MAKPGRPKGSGLLYTDDLAAEICRRIGEGETLQSICRLEGMPSVSAVDEWKHRFPSFGESFACARVRGFDAIAAEAMRIADTPVVGEETTEKANGDTETRKGDMLGHRKLQIETRLKLLAKWDPKRYGERTTLAGDPDNPLTVINKVERTIVKPK